MRIQPHAGPRLIALACLPLFTFACADDQPTALLPESPDFSRGPKGGPFACTEEFVTPLCHIGDRYSNVDPETGDTVADNTLWHFNVTLIDENGERFRSFETAEYPHRVWGSTDSPDAEELCKRADPLVATFAHAERLIDLHTDGHRGDNKGLKHFDVLDDPLVDDPLARTNDFDKTDDHYHLITVTCEIGPGKQGRGKKPKKNK